MESIAAARPTLIFDRQPLWLSALEQVLERNGFAVVATAVAEPHALQLLREHQPSVLVFEPEACMSAPTRFIEVALREVHGLKMIAVSQAEDSASITECLAAGVFAYVLKSAHPEDISLAARQAIHQSIHFAPGRAGTPHLAAVNSVRPAPLDDGSELTQARARDPGARRGGELERHRRAEAVGHRADGEVPPLEHLPQARRFQPHGREPLGARPRHARRGALARLHARSRLIGPEAARITRVAGSKPAF